MQDTSTEKKPAQHGTLGWPIGKQLAMTAILISALFGALHFAARNGAVPEAETPTVPAAPAVAEATPRPLPERDWQGLRVLATEESLAITLTDLGGNGYWFTETASPDGIVPCLTTDQLVDVPDFDVVLVAEAASRPPKQFARKVAKGGSFYLLDPDGNWRHFRENAGMLQPDATRAGTTP